MSGPFQLSPFPPLQDNALIPLHSQQAPASMTDVAAAVTAFVTASVSPGGAFEIGADSWLCGGKPVTFRCFKGPGHSPTLGDYYARHMLAEDARDREFIVYEDERATFGEVYARAAALAHVLSSAYGVKKGDRVCIAMRNYPEWCDSFIAVTAMGGVAVPVNGWWGPHELEYGLMDSGAKVLICDEERLQRAQHCTAKFGIRSILVRGPAGGVAKQAAGQATGDVASYEALVGAAVGKPMPPSAVATDDPAAMMYTSGTTGHPKGVVQTHRGITNQLSMVSWDMRRRYVECFVCACACFLATPRSEHHQLTRLHCAF